jgi:leader peptidase (prepilin peptidase)/N-methyltransferase
MELLWAALGWLAGAGLNAVVHELPRSHRLASRPMCSACAHPLGPAQFTLLVPGPRRRCPGCAAVVTSPVGTLEWPTAIIFGALSWRFGLSPALFIYSLYALILLLVLAIDLRHRWVYSVVCYPGIVLAVLLSPLVGQSIVSGALGALVGGGLFLALYWLGRLVYRGREAMGVGDITIATMIGAMVGPQLVLIALFVGAVLVGGISLMLLASRRARTGDYIPYGAGLCLGALIVLLLGEPASAGWPC